MYSRKFNFGDVYCSTWSVLSFVNTKLGIHADEGIRGSRLCETGTVFEQQLEIVQESFGVTGS